MENKQVRYEIYQITVLGHLSSELAPLSWSSEILGYTYTRYLGYPFLERKKMGVNEEREVNPLVGSDAFRACFQWQPRSARSPTSYPSCSPVTLCNTALFTESKGRGKRHPQDSSQVLGMIAEPTGTDGFRVLCHQFLPSSLSRREYGLTSSKTFSLKMNKLREALLLFSSIGCRCMGYPHRGSP
jgi:hypothetical protein